MKNLICSVVLVAAPKVKFVMVESVLSLGTKTSQI